MAWLSLIVASLGEIAGVASINLYLRDKTLSRLALIAVTFGLGFFFLSKAMQEIPMGTAYAIWTGLGAAGTVLIGILFFQEAASRRRLFFLSCIIAGAAGLKILT